MSTLQQPSLKIKWNIKDMKTIFNVLGSLTDKTTIYFKPDMLSIRTLDLARIAIIVADFPASGFPEYECKKTVAIGLKLKEINEIIRRFRDVSVEVSLTEDSRIKLSAADKSFTSPLVNSDDEWKDVPDIAQPVTVLDIDPSELKEISDDACVGREKEFDPSMVTLEGTKDGKFKLSKDTDHNVRYETIRDWKVVGTGSAMYNIGYISTVIDNMKGVNKVKLKFGGGLPLCVEFDDGTVKFYLAPKK